jgi:8-oxo-dGTP pyrophosphatase MutT (NUDIX family)
VGEEVIQVNYKECYGWDGVSSRAKWERERSVAIDFITPINGFAPENPQETQDKKLILHYIEAFPETILLRDNQLAHITSSGFVVNRQLDKALMVYHNQRNTWAWTGGHADGEGDLLHVAIKEAKEETGVQEVTPLTSRIVSLDILPVYGHMKRGEWVSAHLHLSVAYILIAGESETLIVNEAENSAVRWLSVDQFRQDFFDSHDEYLYNKLIQRAKHIRAKTKDGIG